MKSRVLERVVGVKVEVEVIIVGLAKGAVNLGVTNNM